MPQMVYEDVLAHYGVLGMKWGVRKKEPTADERRVTAQKEAATKAKREVKAQKYVQRAQGFDTRIRTLQTTNFKWGFQRAGARNEIRELRELKAEALQDAQKKREGKLSSGQKKVVIGASVVAALVAAKVIHANVESGAFNRLAQKGQAAIKGKEFEFKKNPELSKQFTDLDELKNKVVKQVNPDFGDIGTKMNCRRATFAYEMRRRGFDVQATRTTNASGQNGAGLLNAINPGVKERGTGTYGVIRQTLQEQANQKKVDISEQFNARGPLTRITESFAAGAKNKIVNPTPESMFEALSKQPNGSRGEIGVMWSGGGGHSMVYELINGKPVIIDGQSGHVWKDAAEMANTVKIDIASSGFTRLDDIDLNENYLMKWIKNAK